MQKIFRTTIPIQLSEFHITHKDQILFLGSCFAEHIGLKMSQYSFEIWSNPLGIYYNPASLNHLIDRVLSKDIISKREFILNKDIFHHWQLHTDFSGVDLDKVIRDLENQWQVFKKALTSSNYIFISLGSAVCFRHLETKKIVANCHKHDQRLFSRETLNHASVIDNLKNICNNIAENNPTAKIIFTVSPVRHLRHGFIENQLGKARLISAIHAILEENLDISYFPSFEIMVDDLRDYRFYAADMIHPSIQAIDYIWDYFSDSYFDKKTRDILKKIANIKKRKEHKSKYPNSAAHQAFSTTLAKDIDALKKEGFNL